MRNLVRSLKTYDFHKSVLRCGVLKWVLENNSRLLMSREHENIFMILNRCINMVFADTFSKL